MLELSPLLEWDGCSEGETGSKEGGGQMMSSQVRAGSRPGPVVAGTVLPVGLRVGKDRWRWNDVEYGEQNCV